MSTSTSEVRKTHSRRKNKNQGSISEMLLRAGWKRVAAISSIVALIIIGVGYLKLLYPLSVTNQQRLTEYEKLSRRNAISRAVQETRPQFIERYRKAKLLYEDARLMLPNNTELSEVMRGIQELAHKHSIKITLFDASTLDVKSSAVALANTTQSSQNQQSIANQSNLPQTVAQTPAAKPVLQERVIPAQLIGNHQNMMQFLRELGGYRLIIHVRDISITSLGKDEQVTIKLVPYSAPPNEALPQDPPELREGQTLTAVSK